MFSLDQLGVAFVIGIIAGSLGLYTSICIGIGRKIFNKLRRRLTNKFLRHILPPIIGGLLIGKFTVLKDFFK